jgi:pantoate--beta-alanine ligase
VNAIESTPAVRVLRTREELQVALAAMPRPLGLVPTMGWLHDGHRSLMQRARAENATTIATIFVNPRQFNEAADYQRYPRNEARDRAICVEEGIDLIFAPDVEAVYPPGFDTTVSVGAIAQPLEGAARPGHFEGVATVVAILFGLIGADRAYFGQKDAQQVLVIRQMARDLAIPTEVIACPTVREPDGLALSSRNVHLTPAERAAAPVLRRALLAARRAWESGERSGDVLRAVLAETLATEPLATPAYVSVADGRTLTELDRVEDGAPALLSLAVRFGSTRLIDNEPLG